MHNDFVAEFSVDFFQGEAFGLDRRIGLVWLLPSCLKGRRGEGAYFGTPEVENDDVEGGEDNEDEVVFPLDAGEGCGSGFDVDDCGEEGADDGPGHALGANVGWEDFT